MSYFNSQINVIPEAIAKLSWIQDSLVYFYKEHDKLTKGIIYEVSAETYEKLVDRFISNTSTQSIKPGDKVYLMPRSKIPLYKLKDHIKKCGATLVNDINKATFFISTDNTDEKTHSISQYSILFNDLSPEYALTNDITEEVHLPYRSDTCIGLDTIGLTNSAVTTDHVKCYLHTNFPVVYCNVENEMNKCFITPIGAMIVYYSILKKAPIVHENNILDQITPTIVIDKEVYETILDMFKSSDSSNHGVAVELLANCDIKPSLYYLWKLSQQYNGYVTNSRMKNIKLFIERSEWSNLYGMTAEQFVNYMYKNDYLTKEIFQECLSTIAKQYEGTLNSPLFKMTLTPSDMFKEFAEPGNVFEINHSDIKTEVETPF